MIARRKIYEIHKRIHQKKTVAFMSIFLLSTGVLAGCSNKNSDQATVDSSELKPYGKYKKPIEFTVGRITVEADKFPVGANVSENPATEFLKKETNITAKVAWETSDFNTKFSLSLADGKMPDVMVVNEVQFQQLIDNDMIADLSPIYEKTASETLKKNYDSYDGWALDSAKRDGKLYDLPQTSLYYEQAITWICKDWLDKVNFPVPKTIDELEKAAKAFVDNKLGR